MEKLLNYKGLFFSKDYKKQYYEGGAHFKYIDLVNSLKLLLFKRESIEQKDKNNFLITENKTKNKNKILTIPIYNYILIYINHDK